MGNRCGRNSYAMPYHRHLLASIVIGVGAALIMGISLSAYTSPGGEESVAQEAFAPTDEMLAVESRSIIVVEAPPEKAPENRPFSGPFSGPFFLLHNFLVSG